MNDLYKRLARAEAMANAQRDELMETMKGAYQRACDAQDAEGAAFYARKIRNRLLADSDAHMTLDRMGLEVPSGASFTAWLSFLRGLGSALLGSWAQYRKALRDLPEQVGFPFDVVFPQKPDESEAEAE